MQIYNADNVARLFVKSARLGPLRLAAQQPWRRSLGSHVDGGRQRIQERSWSVRPRLQRLRTFAGSRRRLQRRQRPRQRPPCSLRSLQRSQACLPVGLVVRVLHRCRLRRHQWHPLRKAAHSRNRLTKQQLRTQVRGRAGVAGRRRVKPAGPRRVSGASIATRTRCSTTSASLKSARIATRRDARTRREAVAAAQKGNGRRTGTNSHGLARTTSGARRNRKAVRGNSHGLRKSNGVQANSKRPSGNKVRPGGRNRRLRPMERNHRGRRPHRLYIRDRKQTGRLHLMQGKHPGTGRHRLLPLQQK